MTTVKLKVEINAEGVCIPAGTVCVVEKYYPSERVFDLVAGEILFWVNEHKIEATDAAQ